MRDYQGTDTEERLTIAGVNDSRDCLEDEEAVALYGRIVKVVIHEDVTEESYLLGAGQLGSGRIRPAHVLR